MNNLKRDINFFAVIGQDSSGFAVDFEKWLKLSLLAFAAIAVAVVVILGGINGGQKLKISGLENDIKNLEEPLAKIEQLKIESEQLQVDIDTFKQSVAEFDQQPRLTIKDMEKIAYCMPKGVVLNTFSYTGEVVTLSCIGDSELAIADFANSLRNSGTKNPEPKSEDDLYIMDFENVGYTGVSKTKDNKYSASITVQLKSRVVVEETTVEATTEAEKGDDK